MESRRGIDTAALADGPERLTVIGSQDLLASLETGQAELASLFRVRNSPVAYRSVHSADVADMESKGWQVVRSGRRQTRLKKPKGHAQALEDRIWCLLYRMGYSHLSPAQFTISFERESGSQGTKQVDVLACDDETAVVVECKSKEVRGRRTLQKDLLETKALQSYIRESVYSHYHNKPKPKLIWIYATNNIIWSEADIERAKDGSIYILTENEIQYFDAYLRHMGPAGKYQILGELLHDQKIPGLSGYKVPAIRGTLGGHKFYSFVTTPKILLKIAFVNHQALNHPDGRPAYQRMISSKRLKEIGDFITRRGGFFPTNILVNFVVSPKFEPLSNKDNELESVRFGWLTLPTVYRSAWIIDGQHRLYGYSRLSDPYLDQNLVVIAFDDMETHQEADLFITINHKQKSVPTSLLVSLLADLRVADPDPQIALSALASRVVRRLSTDIASPLSRRFALPDVPSTPGQNLTISEVVKGLNRSGLIGRVVRGSIIPGPLSGATDDDSIERSRSILNSYFEALRTANPQRWESGKSAYICVNPAIRAHLMLISEMVSYLHHRRGIDFLTLPASDFATQIVNLAGPVFDFVRSASDEKVKTKFSRKFGEGGVREYLFELFGLIHAENGDFGSDDFRRYLDQKASNAIEEANSTIMHLSANMMDCVVRVLKAVYGDRMLPSGEYAYWELGVGSRRVKENAYKKQQEDAIERRQRKEAYLDVVDLKEIIQQTDNWLHFAPIFNVPLPGEKKGKKFYLSWIDRFNEVRRVAAHKSEIRTYSDEDLEFIDWLRAEIVPRIEAELH